MISYLDWRDRPLEVCRAIDASFEELRKTTESTWGIFNGKERYSLCGIDEHLLIREIILHAPPDQRKFTIIELGAGNFQWAAAVAELLRLDPFLPQDIQVDIISTRGEGSLDSDTQIIEIGQSTLYNLSAFKVENLTSQLQERGFDLKGQIDLVISHFCLIHLIDPLGTLLQTLELLRCDGWCLMDGFFVMEGPKEGQREFFPERIAQILLAMKTPFLIYPTDSNGSITQFVLQKVDEAPCHIQMSYAGVKKFHHRYGDGHNTYFEIGEELKGCLSMPHAENASNPLMGDRPLYTKLREWDLFESSAIGSKEWVSLSRSDSRLEEVPTINDFVTDGDGDSFGETPLLLAVRGALYSQKQKVQEKKLDLLQRLIAQGANVNIPDYNGITPLYEAVLGDFDGKIVSLLLEARVRLLPPVRIETTKMRTGETERSLSDFLRLLLQERARPFRPLGIVTAGQLTDRIRYTKSPFNGIAALERWEKAGKPRLDPLILAKIIDNSRAVELIEQFLSTHINPLVTHSAR